MGETVLDPGTSRVEGLRVYAHAQRGAATALVLNLDRRSERGIAVASPSERYMLTAEPLDSAEVSLNGRALRLGAEDALPGLEGVTVPAGPMRLPPASITFLRVPV